MQNALLPLFPLQVVLLPETALSLHIFEERYREMINDAIRDKLEFGVVQVVEKGIANTGCSASIEKVLQQYPDGRMDILIIGRRRFEIILLNTEKSYLRGSVEFFGDVEDESASREIRSKALASYSELKEIEETDSLGEPEPDDPQLSFKLAQPLSDLGFKQLLLSTRSEAERMRQLAEFLPEYLRQRRHMEHVRHVAPRNGDAKWDPKTLPGST